MALRMAEFAKKHRTALAGCGLALAVLLVLAWVCFQTSRQVDGQSSYRILNDTYDQVVELEPGRELVQELAVPQGQSLYGLRLDFCTYERVARGRVTAQLECGGTVLAQTTLDAQTLLDNTFADLLLAEGGAVALPQTGETLALRLRLCFEPETAEDRLGLWATLEPVQGLDGSPLALNEGGGALALQLIDDYSGHWFRRFFLPIGGLLFLAVLGGWWLLAVARAKLTTVFCLEAALLGGAFALVTPPLVAPDEYAHVAGSYALANRLLGQQSYDENGYLLMRACDAAYMTDQTGEVGIFAYRQMAAHWAEGGQPNRADTPAKVRVSETGVNLLYAPQTLGILLARLLGLGFYPMLLLGRLCNLAVYLLLCRFALARLPSGKPLLMACALLPMGLQLAASFSADTLLIGLVFAYLALCLDCARRRVGRWDLVKLLVLAALIGPSKAIYVVTVALCFLIPQQSFGGRARALAAKALCCLAAAAGWLAYNWGYFDYIYRDVDYMGVQRFAWKAALVLALAGATWLAVRRRPRARRAFWAVVVLGVLAFLPVGYYMLSHMWGGLTPDEIAAGIQPNGDSIYTFTIGYICRNIPATLKLLVNTLANQLPTWLQGVLGLSLGEPVVYPIQADWACGVGLVLVLLTAALRQQAEPRRLPGWQLWWVLALAVGVVALSLFASLTWTPINYTILFGVQGRYFLPILPMLLLAVGEWDGLCKQRDLTAQTNLAGVCLCGLVILQGLAAYAAY